MAHISGPNKSANRDFDDHRGRMTMVIASAFNASPCLLSLPQELHLRLFDILEETDPAAAACLGLTCKTFYPLFKHRNITLHLYDIRPVPKPLQEPECSPDNRMIFNLMAAGMPKDMVYNSVIRKFVGTKRDQTLMRMQWECCHAEMAISPMYKVVRKLDGVHKMILSTQCSTEMMRAEVDEIISMLENFMYPDQ